MAGVYIRARSATPHLPIGEGLRSAAHCQAVREGLEQLRPFGSRSFFFGRKDGQHKPLLTIANNAIYAHRGVPFVWQTEDGKKTFVSGTSTTKRNINLPDDNGTLMINNKCK